MVDRVLAPYAVNLNEPTRRLSGKVMQDDVANTTE